jgi:hypothetical protein
MRHYDFLRLVSNKVTSRSYGHFHQFSCFYFLRNWFFQLCQKLQSLIKKTQGILGVKQSYETKLTPKGLNVLRVTKPVLGSVTWPHFIFIFFEFFYEHASRDKLCGSTNFIIFGPTDQKLWVFVIFRRSLGRAGMCWSQPARVDHMCKKRRARRIFFVQRASLGHPAAAGGRLLVTCRHQPCQNVALF